MQTHQQLQIDRSLQNDSFQNWRLGKDFVKLRSLIKLTNSVAVTDTGNVNDYLHTRASVLHNHVQLSEDRAFVFTASTDSAAGGKELWQLLPVQGADPPIVAQKLLELPPCRLPDGLVLAPMTCPADCTVAVVQPCQAQSTEAITTAGASASPFDVVLSVGHGDLRVARFQADGSLQTISDYTFPIRGKAPSTAIYPFRVAGAYINTAGKLLTVLWCVRPQDGAQEAACEVYVVTANIPHASNVPLRIEDVQLLASSSLPPIHVSCSSEADAVLLGLEPSKLQLGNVTIANNAQSNNTTVQAGNGATTAQQSAVTGSAAMQAQEHIEHVDCRPPGWQHAHDDDMDCDIDPRTLAEAAARLAKYTSDEPVGALPHQQWADLYKEAGPEEVSTDTACELLVWSTAGTSVYQPTGWRLSCGAHKLLTADTPGLLAVSDDVDACVLSIEWGQGAQAHVSHTATIPALAYVAAGKSQRKHLLLGGKNSACSAVLVEGTKFCYIYDQVQGKPTHGLQQVVDMQLEQNERILGAALISSQAWVGQQPGSGNKKSFLLLLTQHHVSVLSLSG